ncbi:MAG: PD-(D/E)XK nuclease family protein [Halanaerobiales bacterium]|nr:PD-(D/E)XK nuclease family protein [Halanaerobiales bacterium]
MDFKYLDYREKLIEEMISFAEPEVYIFDSHSTLVEARKYYDKNKELFSPKSLFLMKEDLWDKLFLTDKTIIKEDKVKLIFYGILSAEDKEFFNIDNYSESIDTAFEFLHFYDFINRHLLAVSELNLKVKWQQQRLEKFEEIRKKYEAYLEANDLIDRNLKRDFKYFSSEFINKFDNINFVNILYFNEFDKEIMKRLEAENKNLRISLQLKESDFDESELRLSSLTFPEPLQNEINIYQSREKIVEYANLLSEVDAEPDLSEIIDLNDEKDSFANIISSEMISFEKFSSFTESGIYSFLDEFADILFSFQIERGGFRLELNQLLKSAYNKKLRIYYDLTEKDLEQLKYFSNYEYVYLDQQQFEKMANKKLNRLIDDIKELRKLKNIGEMVNFLKELDLQVLKDAEYENRDLEQFFDSLMELETISLLNIDDHLKKESRKAEQIFKLVLNYLAFKKIRVYKDEDNLQAEVKNLEQSPYKKRERLLMINANQGSIPREYKDSTFLTEADLKDLGLELNEINYLKQKYDFFSHIFNAEKSDLFYIENTDNNQTSSPFIEELKLRYALKESTPKYIEKDQKEILAEIFRTDNANTYQEVLASELLEEDEMLLEKEDFTQQKLSISHYRLENLKRCPFKFYMHDISGIESEMLEIDRKLGLMMIGSIAHDFFEQCIEEFGIPLNNCSREKIREILNYTLEKYDLQIHDYFKKYYHDILFDNLIESLLSLDQSISNRIEKIERAETEVTLDKHDIFESGDGISAYISGRPDILLEGTDGNTYIIDLKTGSGSMEQLALYSLMLNFKERDFSSTVKAIYKIMDNELDIDRRDREKKLEAGIIEELEDLFEKRIYNTIYKSDCKDCDYYEICRVVVK